MSTGAEVAAEVMGTLQINDADEISFVQTLDDAQKYQELQALLNDRLKAGWLSMSRAKYAMGSSAVSQTQYDDEPVAGVRVSRAGAAEDGAALDLVLEDSLPDGGGGKPPLRWFGGLVSPHLRAAQKDFRSALAAAIELANVAGRIRAATAGRAAAAD